LVIEWEWKSSRTLDPLENDQKDRNGKCDENYGVCEGHLEFEILTVRLK